MDLTSAPVMLVGMLYPTVRSLIVLPCTTAPLMASAPHQMSAHVSLVGMQLQTARSLIVLPCTTAPLMASAPHQMSAHATLVGIQLQIVLHPQPPCMVSRELSETSTIISELQWVGLPTCQHIAFGPVFIVILIAVWSR